MYPDLMIDSDGNVTPIEFIPLYLPSTWINEKHEVTNIMVSREFLHRQMRTTSDKRKFKKGKNCYVDGAIYTNDLTARNVKVLDYNMLGNFDVTFEIVGVGHSTNVKVQKANAGLDIMTNTKEIIRRLKKVKSNCRQ
jgi:hypothetical protein